MEPVGQAHISGFLRLGQQAGPPGTGQSRPEEVREGSSCATGWVAGAGEMGLCLGVSCAND